MLGSVRGLVLAGLTGDANLLSARQRFQRYPLDGVFSVDAGAPVGESDPRRVPHGQVEIIHDTARAANCSGRVWQEATGGRQEQ